MITVKLTAAEADALREALANVLAGEFDGTTRQYAALERVQVKLQGAPTAPAAAHPCFESKKKPSGTTTEDCYGDGWHRCKECWRYTE